jgi:hypothetical protein
VAALDESFEEEVTSIGGNFGRRGSGLGVVRAEYGCIAFRRWSCGERQAFLTRIKFMRTRKSVLMVLVRPRGKGLADADVRGFIVVGFFLEILKEPALPPVSKRYQSTSQNVSFSLDFLFSIRTVTDQSA